MIKVGYMEYANVYPIFHKLLQDEGLEFVRGFPAELNVAMRKGEIDISPSSSIEFARNPNLYKVVPNLSVASIGAVKSVNIFSDYKASELAGKKIFFTKESNTSTVLARIILEEFYKVKPIYVFEEAEADAKLLIGDKALFAYYNSDYKHIIDLGLEWNNFTKLPFVFALWIAGHEALNKPHFIDFIKKLYAYSIKSDDFEADLVEKYIRLGYKRQQMLDYWQVIDYSLSQEHLKGLKLFYEYAFKLGETPNDASKLIDEAFIKF